MQLLRRSIPGFFPIWLLSVCLLTFVFSQKLPVLALLFLSLSALVVIIFKWEKSLFLLFIGILPFSFDLEVLPGTNLAFLSEPLALLLTPVFFVLLWQRRKSTTLFQRGLFFCSLVFLLPMLFSYFFSALPLVSLKFMAVNFIYLVCGAFLPYLLLEEKQVSLREIIFALVFGLSLIMIYSFLNYAYLGFLPGTNSALSRPFFKDHTIFSAVLALTVPLGFFQHSLANDSRQKMQYKIWIVLMFLAILISSSRAAWVSVILAWTLFFLIRAGLRLYQLFFFILVIASLIVLNLRSIETYVYSNRNDSNRFQSSLKEQALSVTNITNDVSNLERINRWKCALRMGRDMPLTGYGPGTYQFMYLPYQLNSEMTRISVQSQFYVKEGKGGTAHSEYLLSLAESGVPGLLSWFFLIFVIFIQSFFFIAGNADRQKKYLATLLLTGLTSYFIHGFFNNFLNTINFGIYFWLMIGMLMFLFSKKEKDAAIA